MVDQDDAVLPLF